MRRSELEKIIEEEIYRTLHEKLKTSKLYERDIVGGIQQVSSDEVSSVFTGAQSFTDVADFIRKYEDKSFKLDRSNERLTSRILAQRALQMPKVKAHFSKLAKQALDSNSADQREKLLSALRRIYFKEDDAVSAGIISSDDYAKLVQQDSEPTPPEPKPAKSASEPQAATAKQKQEPSSSEPSAPKQQTKSTSTGQSTTKTAQTPKSAPTQKSTQSQAPATPSRASGKRRSGPKTVGGKQAGYGKKFKDSEGGQRYKSAGTVPQERGRTMDKDQISKRETLGKKMLNAMRRGGDKNAAKLRRNIKAYAKKQLGRAPTRDEQNSFVWALASDWALKGIDYPSGLKRKTGTGDEE